MKCPKCNCYFDGKVCINCGTRVGRPDTHKKPHPNQNNPVEIEKAHSFALLGFRSRKLWKMILSIIYLLLCLVMLYNCITQSPAGSMPAKDVAVERWMNVLMLLLFLSPYIFLSETPLRNVLPLFRRRTVSASMAGYFLFLILIAFAINGLDSLHTPAYQADQENHAYVLLEETPASCEKSGKKHCECEFCGMEYIEEIPALDHDFQKHTLEDGTTVYICSRCGAEETENPSSKTAK